MVPMAEQQHCGLYRDPLMATNVPSNLQSHHRTQKPTVSFQKQEQILFGKASKDDRMSPAKNKGRHLKNRKKNMKNSNSFSQYISFPTKKLLNYALARGPIIPLCIFLL